MPLDQHQPQLLPALQVPQPCSRPRCSVRSGCSASAPGFRTCMPAGTASGRVQGVRSLENPTSPHQQPAGRVLASMQGGRHAQVRFSGCGERFAGVGEGGVVATWRLDAPRYMASDTGPLGRADWACQARPCDRLTGLEHCPAGPV